METIYCKGWSRRRKYANQVYTEKDTKVLYEKREPFGVVIEQEGKPYCFINFNDKFVYVGFLDPLKREYLGYEFWEQDNGKIFLREVQFWEYDGDTDTKKKSTRYRFTPEGEFGIEEKTHQTREVERSYAKHKIDVSPLYEDYPEFDKYDAIIQVDRDVPTTLMET